jgi:hypothetical protein
MTDKAEPGLSLFDLAKELGKREAKKTVPKSPADRDWVEPTSAEMHREYGELVTLGELHVPRSFTWPGSKASKQKLREAAAEVDPFDKIAERATLRRLLKSKKITVHDDCPTVDMVQMAMQSGALGKENKKRSTT